MLLIITLQACSRASVLDHNWICQISIPESEKCQSILVIKQGELLLNHDGTFKLDAFFEACYEKVKVMASGITQTHIALNHIVEIELTAETIQQDSSHKKGKRENHPRTIGFVNLERQSGRGSYSDVWEAIRMKGLYQQPITRRALQCKPVE